MSSENVPKKTPLNAQPSAGQTVQQDTARAAAGGNRSSHGGRFSIWNMVRYLAWLIVQIGSGSLLVARRALTPSTFAEPSIVGFPLRCTTDLEVTWMASSITITPGTLVVGTAHGTDTEPVTVFVHSVFDADRDSVHDGLRQMEDRLLRMTRGSGWEGRSGAGSAAGSGAGPGAGRGRHP